MIIDRPDVSVVIPSRNNRTEKNFSLYYAIRSVIMQRHVSAEIILVDDAGHDGTIEGLAREVPALRIVRSEGAHNNVGRLRNLGAQHATATKLLFIDDDTVLPDDTTLSRTCQLLDDVDFCCGAERWWTSIYWYRHVVPGQSITSCIRTFLAGAIVPRGINRENGFRDLNEFTFMGNYGAITAAAFERIGRFDEQFPGWGFEDTELMMRLCLSEASYAVLADAGIKVLHLNHVANIRGDFLENMKRFNQLQVERGVYFHINHFFNVFEGDGLALFSAV